MRDSGHDSFAKSWTSKFSDGWYLSLKLHERGMWDQLYTWAKLHGDTGIISFRSWSAMGFAMGCDGKTCRKILEKFQADTKVVLHTNQHPGNFLTVFIVNYSKNQHVSVGRGGQARGNLQKSLEISPVTEQNRTEEKRTAAAITAKSTNERRAGETEVSVRAAAVRELMQEQFGGFFQSCLGYGGEKWVTSLVVHFREPDYPADQIERGLESMHRKFTAKGLSPPARRNARLQVWEWIERETVKRRKSIEEEVDEYYAKNGQPVPE